jgi:TRAP transporter TAXI family solute receptor
MSERPTEEDPPEELDEVLLEFLRHHDAGSRIDRESFIEANPALAPRLRELLEAADWIEEMAGPTLAENNIDTPATTTQPPQSAIALTIDPNRPSYDPNADTLDVLAKPSGSSPRNPVSDFPQLDNTQANLPCRFGDYVLERILGRGGMGVVYLANQIALNRRVAIKMIRSGALASDEEVERFYSEARSVAKLTHPNIVTIYHCGESNGHHYFSMDYIPGTDLAKKLALGPLEVKQAVGYVRDVARAIHYAHQHGVVHRDLKPANVLIDEFDHVVITDFGLAKQIGAEQGLTATGAALGTPSYMSPEQALGKSEAQGVATDVYAMGAILFALLTGKPPFQADTVMQTMMHVMHRPAPNIRQLQAHIHADIETIVGKCLEKQPPLRYPSASALADDLERFLNGHPIEAKPPSIARRSLFWFRNIPIVAALTGGKQIEPSTSQRWAQRLFLATFSLALTALFLGNPLVSRFQDGQLPKNIAIASGSPGGMYYDLAGKVSDRMKTGSGKQPTVISTSGSVENLRQLLELNADIALMQESTIRSDQVSVIAPLFFEPIHVLIPTESTIESVSDLKGKKVVLGSKDSGTRQASLKLLKHFGITEADLDPLDADWNTPGIRDQKLPMFAVIKPEQNGLSELLALGEFRLLQIENAANIPLSEPMFRLYQFNTGAYRGSVKSPTSTLATAAMIVVRKDAPSRLVQECLNAIYSDPPITDGIISKEMAAEWQGLPYHPAARRFYSEQ